MAYRNDPRIRFTDTLELKHPFDLVIGRQRREIDDAGRFQIKREHIQGIDPETDSVVFTSQRPVREEYRLFINGHLFSTTWPTGTQRPSVRISKRTEDGRISIHLTRKYTELAAREKQ